MQRTPPVYKRPRLPSPSSALHGDNVVVEAEEVEGRGDGPLSSSHPQQQIVLRHSQQEITFADHLDCDDLDGDAHESFRCTYKCKQMVRFHLPLQISCYFVLSSLSSLKWFLFIRVLFHAKKWLICILESFLMLLLSSL